MTPNVSYKEPAEGTGKRLMLYLTTSKIKLVACLALLGIGTLCFILIPIMLGQAVTKIEEGANDDDMLQMATNMLVLAGVAFATIFTAYQLLSSITQGALYNLRKELFQHTQDLSLNFFDRQPIGELMSSVTNDVDAIAALFQGPLGSIIFGAFLLAIIAVAMVILNPIMAIVALLVIPVMLLIIWGLSRIARPVYKQLQEKLANLSGFGEETLAGARTLIAYRSSEAKVEMMELTSREVRDVGAKAQLLGLIIGPMIAMAAYIGVSVVALTGSAMFLNDNLDLGELVTFINLSVLLILPLFAIFFNYNFILQALAGAKRIFAIIDEEPKIMDKPNATSLPPIEGHVVFKDVDFSYVKGKKILKKNSFTATPGQKIGLCGPTGAGKSTIINILTRYYDIDSGSITVDGHSIYDVTQASLRGQIGVVLQEAFLFSDTVMNNLKYARDGVTDDECIAASKKANCHDFIMLLPDGYQTVLTEGGASLSQGQRQLITIARAMVANPRMLILDEATSNVDTRTEKMIQEAIKELQRGRTSFVIAHRLSTIKDSDRILVINSGEIVEQGPHDELMAKKGFYYNLYISQYKGRVGSVLPATGGASA